MIIENVNRFANSDYDDDIKQFVFDLIELLCNIKMKIDIAQHLFLDLGFFKYEDLEIDNKDEHYVIDFRALSRIDKRVRKTIYNGLIAEIKDDVDNDFFSDLILSFEVAIKIDDWEKKQRKYKLEKLGNEM